MPLRLTMKTRISRDKESIMLLLKKNPKNETQDDPKSPPVPAVSAVENADESGVFGGENEPVDRKSAAAGDK